MAQWALKRGGIFQYPNGSKPKKKFFPKVIYNLFEISKKKNKNVIFILWLMRPIRV